MTSRCYDNFDNLDRAQSAKGSHIYVEFSTLIQGGETIVYGVKTLVRFGKRRSTGLEWPN